ncbi:UNVERIFIED_CONTAM: hypothetical protein PYX00_011809 [Menopon gallinae]|uniref:Thioredoxin domain-containing protein n=1 Tax=Menopon gallinae TaxID=328185 RepID=A0AAW2H8H7_9NEOP
MGRLFAKFLKKAGNVAKNAEPMKKPLRKLEESVNTVEGLKAVLEKEGRVIIVFHASWCRPCKVYEKTIEACRTEHEAPFCRVDVDCARELTQKFGVMAVPCTLVVDADMSVMREVNGVVDEDAFAKLVEECFGKSALVPRTGSAHRKAGHISSGEPFCRSLTRRNRLRRHCALSRAPRHGPSAALCRTENGPMGANFDPKPVKLTKKQVHAAPVVEEEPRKAVGAEGGQKIVLGRTAAGMKQKDLAMKINLPVHVIADWESGRAIFDKKIARKIEEVLKIKLA